MKVHFIFWGCLLLLLLGCCIHDFNNREVLPNYNIVWTTPSKNALGSMPVGGGNLQLNAWCEKDEILFYMGSTDSYLDNSSTLGKLGRIRLNFHPNPFKRNFKQELKLEESEIVFSGDNNFKLTLWVDVFNPVIHVEMQSDIPVDVQARYETWKLNSQTINENQILFYHRNDSINPLLEKIITEQKAHFFRDKIRDPITNLTSGGLMYEKNLIYSHTDSSVYMKTPYKFICLNSSTPLKYMDLRIAIRIEQDNSFAKWLENLNTLAQKTNQTKDENKKESLLWWKKFWNRSYIHINPELKASYTTNSNIKEDSVAAAWHVGRNYQLFRYMLGCTRAAKHPILFNAGIFNVDNSDGTTPETRNWQECEFMAQNQRLIYWPLLKTGDSDILQPAMNMYRDMVSLQKSRAQAYWNIEGTAYPEALNIYGLHAVYADPEIMTDCFGRCPNRKRVEYGHSGLIHLEHHYTSMLDFAYMLLEAARFGYEKLETQMPVIENVVKYYDNYYKKYRLLHKGSELNDNGKLELYPSSALELYADAKNPTDVVSGLRALVTGVLSFSTNELTNEQQTYFQEVLKRLPEIPLTKKNGYTVLPPAETWTLEGNQPNMEFPQLYTLFPFEYYSFENKKELEIAKNTWLHNSKATAQKNYICWFQGGIYAAHLGITDEAKSYTLNKFLHPLGNRADNSVPVMRFPTFWANPGFCECPDIDHGGAAMIGLQDMLLQTQGKHIYLCPAWPKDWDCNFKLHAPYNTIIEGSIRKGKLKYYQVFPYARKNDVTVMNNF